VESGSSSRLQEHNQHFLAAEVDKILPTCMVYTPDKSLDTYLTVYSIAHFHSCYRTGFDSAVAYETHIKCPGLGVSSCCLVFGRPYLK
jgi:hypothetical protein